MEAETRRPSLWEGCQELQELVAMQVLTFLSWSEPTYMDVNVGVLDVLLGSNRTSKDPIVINITRSAGDSAAL